MAASRIYQSITQHLKSFIIYPFSKQSLQEIEDIEKTNNKFALENPHANGIELTTNIQHPYIDEKLPRENNLSYFETLPIEKLETDLKLLVDLACNPNAIIALEAKFYLILFQYKISVSLTPRLNLLNAKIRNYALSKDLIYLPYALQNEIKMHGSKTLKAELVKLEEKANFKGSMSMTRSTLQILHQSILENDISFVIKLISDQPVLCLLEHTSKNAIEYMVSLERFDMLAKVNDFLEVKKQNLAVDNIHDSYPHKISEIIQNQIVDKTHLPLLKSLSFQIFSSLHAKEIDAKDLLSQLKYCINLFASKDIEISHQAKFLILKFILSTRHDARLNEVVTQIHHYAEEKNIELDCNQLTKEINESNAENAKSILTHFINQAVEEKPLKLKQKSNDKILKEIYQLPIYIWSQTDLVSDEKIKKILFHFLDQENNTTTLSPSFISFWNLLLESGYDKTKLMGIMKDENNFLHHACLKNKPSLVSFLISQGFDPNGKNNKGVTPLELILTNSQVALDSIDALILSGANIDLAVDTKGILYAYVRHYIEKWIKNNKLAPGLERLLKHDPEQFAKLHESQKINTLFLFAANPCKGSAEKMEMILNALSYDKKALRQALESKDSLGQTPLDIVAYAQGEDAIKITQLLVEFGSEVPEIGTYFEKIKSPIRTVTDDFIRAIEKGDVEEISRFMNYNFNWMNAPIGYVGETPIEFAAKYNVDSLKFIFEKLRDDQVKYNSPYLIKKYFTSNYSKLIRSALITQNRETFQFIFELGHQFRAPEVTEIMHLYHGDLIHSTRDPIIHDILIASGADLSRVKDNQSAAHKLIIDGKEARIQQIIGLLQNGQQEKLARSPILLEELGDAILKKFPHFMNNLTAASFFYRMAYSATVDARTKDSLIEKLRKLRAWDPYAHEMIIAHENEKLAKLQSALRNKSRSQVKEQYETLKTKSAIKSNVIEQYTLANLYLQNKAPGIFNFNQRKKGIAILEKLVKENNDSFAAFMLAKDNMEKTGNEIKSTLFKLKSYFLTREKIEKANIQFGETVLEAIDKAIALMEFDYFKTEGINFIRDCLNNKNLDSVIADKKHSGEKNKNLSVKDVIKNTLVKRGFSFTEQNKKVVSIEKTPIIQQVEPIFVAPQPVPYYVMPVPQPEFAPAPYFYQQQAPQYVAQPILLGVGIPQPDFAHQLYQENVVDNQVPLQPEVQQIYPENVPPVFQTQPVDNASNTDVPPKTTHAVLEEVFQRAKDRAAKEQAEHEAKIRAMEHASTLLNEIFSRHEQRAAQENAQQLKEEHEKRLQEQAKNKAMEEEKIKAKIAEDKLRAEQEAQHKIQMEQDNKQQNVVESRLNDSDEEDKASTSAEFDPEVFLKKCPEVPATPIANMPLTHFNQSNQKEKIEGEKILLDSNGVAVQVRR